MSAPNPQSILNAVQQALAEDLSHGDVTTSALFPSALQATATIVAHQPMTVAGVAVAREVFLAVDPSVHITTAVKDGSACAAASSGTATLTISQPTAANSVICASVPGTSCVFVVVMD